MAPGPIRKKFPKKKAHIDNPGGSIFLPPGRDLEIRTWDREDTDLWMACFLRPDENAETFLAATKHHLDGESLFWLATVSPQSRAADLGIPEPQFLLIQKCAAAVINERNEMKYKSDMEEWKEMRNREKEERERTDQEKRRQRTRELLLRQLPVWHLPLRREPQQEEPQQEEPQEQPQQEPQQEVAEPQEELPQEPANP